MKIHAAQRLMANAKDLLAFLSARDIEYARFFYKELPSNMWSWFEGYFNDRNNDPRQIVLIDTLQELSGIYHARHHTVYRSVMIPVTVPAPQSKIVTTKVEPGRKPIQSWTTLERPVVMNRFDKHTHYEMILSLDAAQTAKLVLTDYLQLAQLVADAMTIRKKVEAHFNIILDAKSWSDVKRELKRYTAEQEVVLYAPAGTVQKCDWRIVFGSPLGTEPNALQTPGHLVQISGRRGGLCVTTGVHRGTKFEVVDVTELRQALKKGKPMPQAIMTDYESVNAPATSDSYTEESRALAEQFVKERK